MEKPSWEYALFFHKTIETLLIARGANIKIKDGSYTRSEGTGYVYASRSEFRRFLQLVMEGKYKLKENLFKNNMTSEQSLRTLKKALEKSNFDWTNQEQLLNFGDWYNDTFNNFSS